MFHVVVGVGVRNIVILYTFFILIIAAAAVRIDRRRPSIPGRLTRQASTMCDFDGWMYYCVR